MKSFSSIVITGASSGIGEATARRLAREPRCALVLVGRREQRLAALARELGEQRTSYVAGDLVAEDAPARIREHVQQRYGRLDLLVNNAGIGSDFGVSGADPDFAAIQRALDTNFFGAYRVTIALLDLLRASAHPRVVNVSSGMGGVAEMGGWTPGYRVSKASMNAMTRILATELKDAGFLVNSACPGFVNTDMGGPMGATKSVEDGAAGIVWLATLPDDGPTGGFFRDGKPVSF
jgi:NAD(P)-dependent dehydrogenase (short-subunit alcohol dehydrogenase family)